MSRIIVKSGDITKIKVDAIVNAANYTLLGGGGVDGAIHSAAGHGLLEECKTLGGCKVGEVKITKGYNLPAKYVIHAVGPVYGMEEGKEKEFLYNCYLNSLKLAKENNIKTIAFPNISTGAFGFPKKQAAGIAIRAVFYYTKNNPDDFGKIFFVTFDDTNYNIYKNLLSKNSSRNEIVS